MLSQILPWMTRWGRTHLIYSADFYALPTGQTRHPRRVPLLRKAQIRTSVRANMARRHTYPATHDRVANRTPAPFIDCSSKFRCMPL